MNTRSLVVQVLVEWGIPALGSAIAGWIVLKRRAIRASLSRRRALREAHDSFVEKHMPVLVDFATGSADRGAKAAMREMRITTQMQMFGEHLSRQDEKLDSIAAQLWAHARFDLQARFRCDNSGRNVSVNTAYAKLLRVSEFELGDFRWKNCIDENDAPRYMDHVQRCFREYRRFDGEVIFRRGDGNRFRAHVRIEPYPEDPEDLAEGSQPMWFGVVMLLEDLS